MITQLKLDESTKLEFGVSVTGADSQPNARFIIEGKQFSIMIPCRNVNESAEVEIPALKNILSAGEYPVRLEVVIDNKIYTPMSESIVFEPCIEIATKSKPVQAIKESVKVAKVTVKKSVNEDVLRKTQAATIIAQSIGYAPSEGESPRDIIENAIKQAGEMSVEKAAAVEEMLKLAESTGIDVTISPKMKIVVTEEKKPVPKDEDDMSDEELDDMISGLEHEDILSAYEDSEFGVYDEHGNLIEEELTEGELNEVLSRAERMKVRLRMARNKTKTQVKLKIALHKHSSGAVLNHRARRLAVKAMEKKLARNKPLSQLSVSEKERIERIVQRRKKAIDRMAMKLVPHVRQIEKERLSR
jgi:hypothetical protein